MHARVAYAETSPSDGTGRGRAGRLGARFRCGRGRRRHRALGCHCDKWKTAGDIGRHGPLALADISDGCLCGSEACAIANNYGDGT